VYPALAVMSRSRLECRTRRPRGGIASLQQEFRAYDAQGQAARSRRTATRSRCR